MERSDLRETYTRATELYRQKRYQEALTLLRELNEAFPGEPALLYSCALCLASLGRSMEAIGLCDRLIREHRDVRGVELRARIAAILADAEEQQVEPPAETGVAAAGEEGPPAPPAQPVALGDNAAEPAEALAAAAEGQDSTGPPMPAHAADDVELLSDETFDSADTQPSAEPPAPPRRRRPVRAIIAAALLLIAAGGLFYWQRTRPAPPPAPPPPSGVEAEAPRAWAFPGDRVFGELAWRGIDAPADAAWTPLGPARGEVTLPEDAAVRMEVRDYHWLDPAVFGAPGASRLTELDLDTRFLDDATAADIPLLPNVRTLRVAGAIQLTDTGLAALLEASTPESLALAGVPLLTGDGVAAVAAQTQLVSVDLSGTRLSADDLIPLTALPSLTSLRLPATASGDSVAALAEMDALEVLGVGAKATGPGFEALAGHPALRRVELRAGATATGLAAVVALPHLTALAVSGPLENGDLRPLDAAPDLRELALHATPVDAETAPALAELQQLESLSIDLPPDSQAAPALAEAVAGLPRLHTLALLGDAVGDEALAPLTRAAMLHTLDLTGSRVTADGIASLAGLPALRNLVLDDTPAGDQVAAVLAGMDRLREVSLVRAATGSESLERLRRERPDLTVRDAPARDVRYVGFPPLDPLGRVYTTPDAAGDAALELVGRGAGDVPVPRTQDVVLVLTEALPEDGAGLESVAGNGVQGVVLHGEAPTAPALASAASYPALERLTLDGPRVTDALLAGLPSARALERLDLENSAVTAAGVGHAARALPDLLRLSLRGSAGAGDDALQPVSTLHRLQTLDLRETGVTDNGLDRLRPLLALERVLLEGTGVTAEGVAELRKALPGATVTYDARAFETAPVEDPPPADAP